MGEDSQGFVRLWERICKDLQDFGRGFTRIRETLGENLQGLGRLWERICQGLWERIHETLGEDLQGLREEDFGSKDL